MDRFVIGQPVEWLSAGQACQGRITTFCGPNAAALFTLTAVERGSQHLVTIRSPGPQAPARHNQEAARYAVRIDEVPD